MIELLVLQLQIFVWVCRGVYEPHYFHMLLLESNANGARL